MTAKGHIWFRNGWYRACSETVRFPSWIKRVNRLGLTGQRAREMGLRCIRLEYGGLDYEPKNAQEYIEADNALIRLGLKPAASSGQDS